MTSNINYLTINENYPVAGQDNDTQTFRDNFSSIKTNFQAAASEITALQSKSVLNSALGGTTPATNDLGFSYITKAMLQNNRNVVWDFSNPLTATPQSIDYIQGNYQVIRLGADITFTFSSFPGDPGLSDTAGGMGKVTLELYSDGSARTATFQTSGIAVIKANGFPLSKIGNSQQPVALPTSTSTATIVEIWRRRESEFFMRYVGQFS